MNASNKGSIKNLILVPAVITLAVTLLRVTGELLNWSPVLFNKAAGGGGALIGISWLVPVVLMATVAGILIARQGWSSLSTALLAYGLSARIPVALLMLFAIMGNWGTHYDVPPPNFPAGVGLFAKWVQIGLIPQFTIWMAFTVIVGSIFGGIALAVTKRSPALAKAVP